MRRLIVIVAAAIAVLLAADTVLWRWAIGRVTDETALWAEARRAEGWTVSLGPQAAEGWPLAARIRLDDIRLAARPPTLPVEAELGAGAATIGVGFLAPRTLVIALRGPQHVRLGAGPDLAFTTERHEITVPLTDDRMPQQADLAIEGLRAAFPPDAPPVTVQKLALHADFPYSATPAEQTLSLTARIGPIDLPAGQRLSAIGPRIDHLDIDARLAARQLELSRLDLNWGRLELASHASLQLDARRQPAGTGEARISGSAETLDALVVAHLLAPRAASAAKAVLAFLQRPQPNGPPVVELPVVLQDQLLQVGHFPIARLPDIAW